MTQTIKIACIGDSVVYGYGVPEAREHLVWTTILEQLLNSAAEEEADRDVTAPLEETPTADAPQSTYEVRNFGLNGQSVLPGAFVPYTQIESPLYHKMKEWQPDGVFLHVGGNDSHVQYWDAQRFAAEYERLVCDLISLCGRGHLCLMAPPKARDEEGAARMLRYGLQNDILISDVIPVICRIAEKYGTDLIDVCKMNAGHPELYYDEIHPNKAGNELLADAACTVVREWKFAV